MSKEHYTDSTLVSDKMMEENVIEHLLNEMFPDQYEYKILKCDTLEVSSGQLKFKIELRVNIFDEKKFKSIFSTVL